ncbi:hypothetical protein [Pseudooceanicola sp. 200-1SW]|uniref:hypothetical protein n=1 Tax=Pseudooceanicola sp. 200-1SW TaxID=3425949 RepID=UPI003D7F5B08
MSVLPGAKGALTCLGTLMVLSAGAASANEAAINASISAGLRYYTNDGLYVGQSSAGAEAFAEIGVDGYYGAGEGRLNFDLEGVIDSTGTLNSFNIAELNYTHSFGAWSVLAGFHTENWGVAESRSVMNVMNPLNGADPVVEDALLGTPMLNINYQSGVGTFSVYALLGFVEPIYPDGQDGRFRSFLQWDPDRAYYEEEDDARHLDIALRYSGYFSLGAGSLDVQATYFNGTSREALAMPGCINSLGPVTETVCDAINDGIAAAVASSGNAVDDVDGFWDAMEANMTDDLARFISGVPQVVGLIPYYQKLEQVGLSAVYAINDLQLRFEASYHDAGPSEYLSAVVGGDYTFNGFAGGQGDLTVALEYLYDDRGALQPVTVFEDDVFLGMNYRLNNTNDTEFKLGIFHDTSSEARLYTLGVSSRLSDASSFEINASHVTTTGWNDPLAFIKDDSFVEMKITSYF